MRGGGVRGFARLGDDYHDGIRAGVGRAVAIFAGVFDVDRDAGQVFHHDFAGQTGVTAGAAGGDDYFLESEERVFDGLQGLAENNVAIDVLANRFANRSRLLVDFAEHGGGECSSRGDGGFVFVIRHQWPAGLDGAGMSLPSFRWMVAESTFQPDTVRSTPPKTAVAGKYCAVSSRVSPGISSI